VRYSIVSSEATAAGDEERSLGQSGLAIGLPISILASAPSRHWSRCGFTVKIYLDRLAQLYASQSQENGGLGYFCARAKGIFWFLKEVLDIRG
jgi:hypothetical protein